MSPVAGNCRQCGIIFDDTKEKDHGISYESPVLALSASRCDLRGNEPVPVFIANVVSIEMNSRKDLPLFPMVGLAVILDFV